MSRVGIRELKQNASDVVSRAENGETIDVTLHGRPVARISPIHHVEKRRWVPTQDLAEALASVGPDKTGWLDEHHRSREDDPLGDPWESASR